MPKLGQPSNQPPRGYSPATQALLAAAGRQDAGVQAVPGRKAPACVACADTGYNSRGGYCYPCLEHGRIRPMERTK